MGYTPTIAAAEGGPAAAPSQDLQFFMLSSQAKWEVEIRPGIFSDLGVILGKVFADANENGVQDDDEQPVPNVALVMEDGTSITTDEYGKYSVPEVTAGLHVVALDLRSLPRGFEATESSTAFAGDGTSRFVDVPASGLVKVDFALKDTAMPAPMAAPTVEQPSPAQAFTVALPTARFVQPTAVAPKAAPAPRRAVVTQTTGRSAPRSIPPPVFHAASQVAQPTRPAPLTVTLHPSRIPAGDPEITVLAPESIRDVVAEHPDGTLLPLVKRPDGAWWAHFLIPFDVSEGPYRFLVRGVDADDRASLAVVWITVDNTIPSIYAQATPSVAAPGDQIGVRVTLLFPAREVSVDFRNGDVVELKMGKHKRPEYHWEGTYTVPDGVKPGWHYGRVTAHAALADHKATEAVAYTVRTPQPLNASSDAAPNAASTPTAPEQKGGAQR
jgi:hypothetical protein